jgi:hypothetical protein
VVQAESIIDDRAGTQWLGWRAEHPETKKLRSQSLEVLRGGEERKDVGYW